MINVTDAPAAPSSDDYLAAAQRRRRLVAFWMLVLAALCAASFVAFGLDSLVLPLVLLILVFTPVLVWCYPRLSLYVTFAAACLFEMFQTSYSDALTDRVPFFWNVNTIFQTYAHIDFKAVPLNLFEVFISPPGSAPSCATSSAAPSVCAAGSCSCRSSSTSASSRSAGGTAWRPGATSSCPCRRSAPSSTYCSRI